MRVLGAGAVEPLVAVLALEAEALPLVDRPDVLLQADLRRQLLPAYVAHDAPAMLGLLVPKTHCSAVTTWYEAALLCHVFYKRLLQIFHLVQTYGSVSIPNSTSKLCWATLLYVICIMNID